MMLPNDWQFWVLVGGVIFNAGVTWTMVRQLRKDINGHITESGPVRDKVNVLWDRSEKEAKQ